MKREEPTIWASLKPGLIFVLVIWLVKITEEILGIRFVALGIYPLRAEGLIGVLTAPLVHGDWIHLVSNTFPLFILMAFIFHSFPKTAYPLTFWLFISTGFWTWCFARESYHIGASGIVYGYASFLFFSGFFRKDRRYLAFSFLMILLYSGMLAGLVPNQVGISWESHWAGGIAGLGFAYFFRDWDLPESYFHWMDQNTEPDPEEEPKIFLEYMKRLEDGQ